MPIRDVERYAVPRAEVRVLANRGANGIDGVVSTAVGVALGSGRPAALLIGDVAFLHDSNGLLGAAGRDVDLLCVVVDNDGGGIFSFLPQAAALAPERFETLFGTPHGLDLVALAAAYGVAARRLDPGEDLTGAVAEAAAVGGVRVPRGAHRPGGERRGPPPGRRRRRGGGRGGALGLRAGAAPRAARLRGGGQAGRDVAQHLGHLGQQLAVDAGRRQNMAICAAGHRLGEAQQADVVGRRRPAAAPPARAAA